MAPPSSSSKSSKAPKASKASKAAAAAAADDDSPQKILAKFAPYLDQGLFDTLRFSRDALLKEIKSTTPIYADWALHVFKALYPPSGTNTAAPTASNVADTDANAKIRNHPLNTILDWESLLQDYRAAASASASTDDAAKPDTAAPALQKGGKKGGKKNTKKSTSKSSTPSASTSNLPAAAAPASDSSSTDLTAYPSGAALLKHLLDQWIAQQSRLAGSSAIDPCDLSTMLAAVCSTLQFMSESQVADALAADAATPTSPKALKRAPANSDSDSESDAEDDADGPFTETIFHTLHHDKSLFSASSSRVVSLLRRDEEIQIIDPDELLRPSQVDQEHAIVNARVAQFNTQFAKVLATLQAQAWAFSRQITDMAVASEAAHAQVRERAAQLPARVLAWGSGDKQRELEFDAEWAHVVNMYKVKRKSTDRAVIDAVNAKFEAMVHGLVANHTHVCTQVVPTLVDQMVHLAEALVDKSKTPFPELAPRADDAGVDADGNAVEAPPSSAALHDTLSAESQALLSGVHAAVAALTQRLADEQAAVAAEAQGVLAAFAVANENPLTVGHRLDRAAKGDVRKLAVRLVKLVVGSAQTLAADVADVVLPLGKVHAFVLKWLALSMLVCEVMEARVLGMTAAKLDEATGVLLDKRDEVMNLYQDGLEAGIRTLDLSMRNVVLDEMTTLAATQRAKDKERELFDDGPKAAGKKKKGKGKAVAEVSVAPAAKPVTAAAVSAHAAETKKPPTWSALAAMPTAASDEPATAKKGKKNKESKPTAAPISTMLVDDAAPATDLHSSTSIDGVERTIPKELLAVMSSPVARRTGSTISRSSNNSSPVPSPMAAQPRSEVEFEPKTAADALFASAALTADPEVEIEAAVDDGSATPFADSNSRGLTPTPNPADADADDSDADFPQPPTSAPDIDLPSLLQETHDLRTALTAAQSAAQRAESAVAQLMAEHARLSQLRQLDQDTANATIKELRGQVARLTAEVHSFKSRGGSSPKATVSPPGTSSADRSPPAVAYRMFGPAPTPATAAAAAAAPPGMSGPPPGLASSATALADPWAVPFATGPVSSRTPAAGVLPPGFGAAAIKPPTPGAVGSPATSSLLVKSPSGSKLDELNQDSVPAHPIRSHARGHRGHYTRSGDAADHGHGHGHGHGHHAHQERHERHERHHRKGQAGAAADGESATADEAATGDQHHQGGARKQKWSAQTNQVRCAKCFARGHASDACTVTCSKCGETGHLARMCTA